MTSSYSEFQLFRVCSDVLRLRNYSESVFVGESKFDAFRDTLYAIPSYVDDNTPTVKRNAVNLLEGPKSKINQYVDVTEKPKQSNKRNYIIFGHYEPPTADLIDTITGKDHSNKQLTVPADNLWYSKESQNDDKIIFPEQTPNKSEAPQAKDEELAQTKPRYGLLKTSAVTIKHWFDNEENKILKLLMVRKFCLFRVQSLHRF